MEKEFWLDKWEKQQIGFHKDGYNEKLLEHYNLLNLKKNDTILVPLCGKTLDLIWLASKGLYVIGVELSELAINDFFKENNLEFAVEEISGFKKYVSNNITLFHGDIFNLTSDITGKIDAIYDRASTVALPVDMRISYLKKITELNKPFNTLMVLLEYDQSKIQGPPFSVDEEFIREKLSHFQIDKLEELFSEAVSPKFKEAGADTVQKVYHIRS